jgi:hypothetical protein
MKKIAFFTFSLMVGISFFACVKNEDATVNIDNGSAYYPLTVGKYKIYQIDSILYDTTSAGVVKVDSFRLFQKEVVTDTFLTSSKKVVYTIDRYERRNTSAPWVLRDVIGVEKTENQLIREDKGLRFVKMVFPVRRRQSWNSLLYIDPELRVKVAGEDIAVFKNWDALTLELNKAETIAGKKYAKVMTIKYADEENKIELRRVTEKYVRDTGLVFNESFILDTQAASSTENWRKKAQRGFIFRQILIENN